MARTIRSIHAKKARQSVRRPSASTGRNPGTGSRRTKRQAQTKRAAGIRAFGPLSLAPSDSRILAGGSTFKRPSRTYRATGSF